MTAVKKATSGAIEGVEWALGKQLLACARPKLRPPLHACLPADLYSSNLTRCDFESHDRRPNVWRLGYLYSTYSGAGRCGVIPSLSRYFVGSCLSVSALSVAPSLRPPSSSLPPSVTSSVFPRLRSDALALVVVPARTSIGPCSLPRGGPIGSRLPSPFAFSRRSLLDYTCFLIPAPMWKRNVFHLPSNRTTMRISVVYSTSSIEG
jgi:hypothetical protein